MTATMTRGTPTLEFKEFQGIVLDSKAPAAGEAGEFVVEALVAVTGNTDDGGDVIVPGAINFKRAPKVVWSHDLKTLVGKVTGYEEWMPDDVRLPADLKAKGYGALWFKMEFDPEDPESMLAHRKIVFHEDLGWSIGYETDPKGFKVLPGGVRALTKIYVWEGSPTTFGMNQEARTVSVKSLISTAVEDLGLSEEKAKAVLELVETLVKPDEEKSYPALEGSFEEVQANLWEAIRAWGNEAYGEVSGENDWYCSIEGTFDAAVVASFRFYSGQAENTTLRFSYAMDDSGGITLSDPTEVEVRATVAPATEATPPPAEEPVPAETASLDLDFDGKTLEEVVTETKKGAVLSAANASKLQAAQEALAAVLAAAKKEEADDEGDKAKDDDKKKKPKPGYMKGEKDDEKGSRVVVEKETPDLEGKAVLDPREALEMLSA